MMGFLIGVILGIVYFGGLYLTVKKITEVKYANILMILSFFLRMGILVGVFYYLSKGGYQDMLFGLAGVILARFVMIYISKKQVPNPEKKR